jgi:hypothetical protein
MSLLKGRLNQVPHQVKVANRDRPRLVEQPSEGVRPGPGSLKTPFEKEYKGIVNSGRSGVDLNAAPWE